MNGLADREARVSRNPTRPLDWSGVAAEALWSATLLTWRLDSRIFVAEDLAQEALARLVEVRAGGAVIESCAAISVPVFGMVPRPPGATE